MYTVYALADPRDRVVRYIGITKDVYARMRQHSRCEGNNEAKNAWIRELQKEQLMFIMHSLEKVRTFEKALERERVWITAQLNGGLSLFNIVATRDREVVAVRNDMPPVNRKQKFRIADLCKVEFCVEGQRYRADTAPSEIFHAFISEYISDPSDPPEWDRLNHRSANLSGIWKHAEKHGYTFPITVLE